MSKALVSGMSAAFAVGLSALLLAGCGGSSTKPAVSPTEGKPNPTGPIVALITDISGSTEELRHPGGDFEKGWLATATATALARGSLWATVADGETLSSSTWLINGKGFTPSVEGNDLLGDGEMKKKAKELLPEARKELSMEGAEGSDLLGALQAAARLFADYPDRQRALVLLTDGAINKGGIRTSSTALRTEAGREKAINDLKQQGLIAGLSGGGEPVRVWIGGLGYGVGGGDAAKTLQIIEFWKALIPAAGGELVSQDSSLRLVAFP